MGFIESLYYRASIGGMNIRVIMENRMGNDMEATI